MVNRLFCLTDSGVNGQLLMLPHSCRMIYAIWFLLLLLHVIIPLIIFVISIPVCRCQSLSSSSVAAEEFKEFLHCLWIWQLEYCRNSAAICSLIRYTTDIILSLSKEMQLYYNRPKGIIIQTTSNCKCLITSPAATSKPN